MHSSWVVLFHQRSKATGDRLMNHYLDLSPTTQSFPEGLSKVKVSARVAQLVAAAEIHWSGP